MRVLKSRLESKWLLEEGREGEQDVVEYLFKYRQIPSR